MWKEIMKDPKTLVAIGTTVIAVIAVQGLVSIATDSYTQVQQSINTQVEVQRKMTKALEANTQVTSQFQSLLLKAVDDSVSLNIKK